MDTLSSMFGLSPLRVSPRRSRTSRAASVPVTPVRHGHGRKRTHHSPSNSPPMSPSKASRAASQPLRLSERESTPESELAVLIMNDLEYGYHSISFKVRPGCSFFKIDRALRNHIDRHLVPLPEDAVIQLYCDEGIERGPEESIKMSGSIKTATTLWYRIVHQGESFDGWKFTYDLDNTEEWMITPDFHSQLVEAVEEGATLGSLRRQIADELQIDDPNRIVLYTRNGMRNSTLPGVLWKVSPLRKWLCNLIDIGVTGPNAYIVLEGLGRAYLYQQSGSVSDNQLNAVDLKYWMEKTLFKQAIFKGGKKLHLKWTEIKLKVSGTEVDNDDVVCWGATYSFELPLDAAEGFSSGENYLLPFTDYCMACNEDKKKGDMPLRFTSACDHEPHMCKDCHVQWIQSNLGTIRWDRLRCPECPEVLQYHDVKRYAPQELFDRYDDLSLKTALQEEGDFNWCLSPQCTSGQMNDTGCTEFACHECRKRYCLRHRVPWHDDETCESYDKKNRRKRKEEKASERVIKKTSKACPKCSKDVQKSHGCNHMTCLCGHEWCYSCLAPYEFNADTYLFCRHNSGCPERDPIMAIFEDPGFREAQAELFREQEEQRAFRDQMNPGPHPPPAPGGLGVRPRVRLPRPDFIIGPDGLQGAVPPPVLEHAQRLQNIQAGHRMMGGFVPNDWGPEDFEITGELFLGGRGGRHHLHGFHGNLADLRGLAGFWPGPPPVMPNDNDNPGTHNDGPGNNPGGRPWRQRDPRPDNHGAVPPWRRRDPRPDNHGVVPPWRQHRVRPDNNAAIPPWRRHDIDFQHVLGGNIGNNVHPAFGHNVDALPTVFGNQHVHGGAGNNHGNDFFPAARNNENVPTPGVRTDENAQPPWVRDHTLDAANENSPSPWPRGRNNNEDDGPIEPTFLRALREISEHAGRQAASLDLQPPNQSGRERQDHIDGAINTVRESDQQLLDHTNHHQHTRHHHRTHNRNTTDFPDFTDGVLPPWRRRPLPEPPVRANPTRVNADFQADPFETHREPGMDFVGVHGGTGNQNRRVGGEFTRLHEHMERLAREQEMQFGIPFEALLAQAPEDQAFIRTRRHDLSIQARREQFRIEEEMEEARFEARREQARLEDELENQRNAALRTQVLPRERLEELHNMFEDMDGDRMF